MASANKTFSFLPLSMLPWIKKLVMLEIIGFYFTSPSVTLFVPSLDNLCFFIAVIIAFNAEPSAGGQHRFLAIHERGAYRRRR